MDKFTAIDRAACATIRDVLTQALRHGVFEGLGLSVRVKGASFSSSNVTFKVEVALVSADGTVATREAKDFTDYASLYGLLPSDLGREFKNAGVTYKIVGAKPRSAKAPILASRTTDDKVFKFPVESIKVRLAGAPGERDL